MELPTPDYNVVCYGEVLWDILLTGPLPGGAPMNVAYHLKKLGMNPALITKVGYDDYGRDLVDMLAADEIAVKYEVDKDYPTGLVYANVGENHEMMYDIIFPSAWDFIEWKPEYTDIVSAAEFFVFGSLTSRNDVSRNTLYQLVEAARTNAFDINIRAPHFEQGQLEYLLHKTDLLKMNDHELQMVTDWSGRSGDLVDRMQFVQDHYKIPQIIVTRGGDGAILNDNGRFYENPGYKVEVQDTIGSGDSFFAGFMAQILKGSSMEEALDFAAGMGAFIATKAGGCPEYEVDEIQVLMEREEVREE